MDLCDANGALIGLFLGVVVDADGRHVADQAEIDTSGGVWDGAEDYIIGLAGRYLLIVTDGAKTRVYGDPSNSFRFFYNSELRLGGPSVLLCIDRPIEYDPDFDAAAIQTEQPRYCFGRSADRQVASMPANHWLCLEDGETQRFWPREGELVECDEAELPRWFRISPCVSAQSLRRWRDRR